MSWFNQTPRPTPPKPDLDAAQLELDEAQDAHELAGVAYGEATDRLLVARKRVESAYGQVHA